MSRKALAPPAEHEGPGVGIPAATLALLALISAWSPSASSQERASDTEIREALMATLTRPDDAAAVLRYAELMVTRNEPTAARMALERFLQRHPERDDIRMQVASLHARAGSPDLAASYAAQARSSAQMPEADAQRVDAMIRESERAAARSVLAVSLFAGVRYETNANAVTQADTISVWIPDFGFQPSALQIRAQSDWSSVFSARVVHQIDLELQREAIWETNGYLFDQRFARIARDYDSTIVGLDTGPRIGLATLDGGASVAIRPYATLAWLGYADTTYGTYYGGGATLEVRVPPSLSLEFGVLSRFGNFQNNGFRPRARDYNGQEFAVSAGLSYRVSPQTTISFGISHTTGTARQDFYDRAGIFLSAGLQHSATIGGYEFGVGLRAAYRNTRFDAPDPALNPEVRRTDERWEAGASLIFPLTRTLAVTLDYDWTKNRSNYEVYRLENHAVTLGLRFTL